MVIGCGIGNLDVQRNNINTFVLDTVIGLGGKVERGKIDMGCRESDKYRMSEGSGRMLTT